MSKLRFLTWCRLTCMGGSERGECPCARPNECQLQEHPEFDHYRDQAKARMFRYLMTELPDRTHPAIIAALTSLNKAEPTAICHVCNQEVAFIPELGKFIPHSITVDGRKAPCPGAQDA